jgi:hypothetical protein
MDGVPGFNRVLCMFARVSVVLVFLGNHLVVLELLNLSDNKLLGKQSQHSRA